MAENEVKEKEVKLTNKQIAFCREYILDWNATQAAIRAGYSKKTAQEIGAQNLSKLIIQSHIQECKNNLEEIAGISRLRVIQEHAKLAFSSIAHLHNTWIERKEFESLTDDQRSCISEISTQTRTVFEYDTESKKKKPVEIEFVKIKLYDKQKSLDSISKILGYDSETKIKHSGEVKTGFTVQVVNSANQIPETEQDVEM